eukprot:5866661-Amphidinium_carterae.1
MRKLNSLSMAAAKVSFDFLGSTTRPWKTLPSFGQACLVVSLSSTWADHTILLPVDLRQSIADDVIRRLTPSYSEKLQRMWNPRALWIREEVLQEIHYRQGDYSCAKHGGSRQSHPNEK